MSFFGKFKGGAATAGQTTAAANAKKDFNAPRPTALEKHLQDATGPVRQDGSDKFYGFENYGSTCYCNSIIQCLYYSTPFRSHVINFPSKDYLQDLPTTDVDGKALSPRSTSATPWPNATSPARKQPPAPGSPAAQGRPEETKDSPEYRKRMALQAGPVLDMIHDSSNRYGMDESLFTALKDIFDAIIGNPSRIGVVSPHKFLEILRRENEMFRSAMHQDAHEFLNLLLNEVVENVEAFAKQHPITNGGVPGKGLDAAMAKVTQTTAAGPESRWVHDLFEGLLTSETRCLSCENVSQRDEPFLDLSVDLSAHSSVTACLRQFSEEEMLCERNKFHCDGCGGLQEAEKRMKIKRLPRVLALHLKRFKYTEDLQRLQKLFHRVVYPFHLRLFNTTEDAEDPDRLYELYAVIVHIGGGPYHGHYVSIIKTQDRGWLLFDDELVEPVDKSYVMNFFGGEPVPGLQDAKQLACAYVLFYQETTLEAMLKEQEMEGQKPEPTAETVDAEAAREILSPNIKNVPVTRPPLATPINEEPPGMESLAHATTAPDPAPPLNSPLEHSQTFTPVLPTKSKRDRKVEEKEKKAAEKAAAKAETKALEEKRRQISERRVEQWRKQDEEFRSVLEASKQSALEESKARDEDPSAGKDKESGGGGGLARFKSGSMSLRSKPKFLGGGGAKDSTAGEKLPPVPQQEALPVLSTGDPAANASANGATAGKEPPAAVTSPTAEEKTKRNRFSLGRKKTQAL